MPSAVSLYAFMNAKLRGKLSKLLSDEFMRRLAAAPTLVEAMTRLADTPYAPASETYNETGDIKLCELELLRIEKQSLTGLDRFIPDAIRGFTDAVLLQYEVETVKNALRLWFERVVRGRRVDDKIAYLLRDDDATAPVDAVINAETTDEVAAALEGTRYGAAVSEPLGRVDENSSIFWVDVALDRWYYGLLIEQANTLDRRDREVAMRLIGIQIDLQNIDWLVRMRHYYEFDERQLLSVILPGGTFVSTDDLRAGFRAENPMASLASTLGPRFAPALREAPEEGHGQVRRLALLEQMLRSVLFQEIRRVLGGYPFTIGTMLAYFLLIQNEVRTLSTVLNGKYYDLPSDRIEALI